MARTSPEEIQMRRAEIDARRNANFEDQSESGYAGSDQQREDDEWLAKIEAEEAASKIIADPEAEVEDKPKPQGSPIVALAGSELEESSSPPKPKAKSYAELKAAKQSSTVMPMPDSIAKAKPVELPKRFTLPGKLQKEYDRARKLSNVEAIGKKMFATKTVDPQRKELDAERKRATDMVNLVEQILDQRAQLAIALANVHSTINLKERREEDLQYMAQHAASLSKTIVGGLTEYDLQSYTLIAGLNNLPEDQGLRRAGYHVRERVLELTKVAASMLADARFRMQQLRVAGLAAMRERDELKKRIAELTGEEYKPEAPPEESVN